jgi:hypothetical protein
MRLFRSSETSPSQAKASFSSSNTLATAAKLVRRIELTRRIGSSAGRIRSATSIML